jgi:hypothetical protein
MAFSGRALVWGVPVVPMHLLSLAPAWPFARGAVSSLRARLVHGRLAPAFAPQWKLWLT